MPSVRSLIWNDNTTLLITVCIVAVGVGVRVLGRRTCDRCCGRYSTLRPWKKGGLCAQCQIRLGSVTREVRLVWRVTALLPFVVFWLVLWDVTGKARGSLRAIYPPLVCAMVMGFWVRLACGGRRSGLLALLRWIPAAWESLDLRMARRAAKAEGEVVRKDGYTLWTDGGRAVAGEIDRAFERTRDEAARMAGTTAIGRNPVRVLCFGREDGFQAYTAKMTAGSSLAMGYYMPWPARRVVVNGQMSRLFPGNLEDVFAHELAHHLLWRRARRGAWIQEGLAVMATGGGPRDVEPFARQRLLRAALQRGELATGTQLISTTYATIYTRLTDPLDVEAIGHVRVFYTQSAGFLAYLRCQDEDRFRRFILSRWPRWHTERVFRRCFGRGPDEAMEEWLARLRKQEIPPHQPPSSAARQRLDVETLPAILTLDAPVAKRLLAVFFAVASGYPYCVAALAQLLDDEMSVLREGAQRALEDIAGEVGRKGAEEWRAWAASVAPNPAAADNASGPETSVRAAFPKGTE